MASMRTIGVKLRMEIGDYVAKVRGAKDETDKLGDSVGKTGRKAKADLGELASAAGIAGAALVGMAAVAVVAAARFDKQMSEVEAVAGATAEEMQRLRDAALEAGAATVFSATEAAQAEAELAKAGIAASDILGGALTGSLSLASAGSLDLAQSAEIAAAAMNTFDLSGSDVTHIADVLAAAANKSAAGVADLGQGLQQVGLVANQVGLSLEETVGLLAAFADRGLRGSDGATSLKTALQRLAAPQEKAAELMEELGISMYDATGNTVGAADIAGQLQAALTNLAPAQRNAAMQTIFGADAIRAANILYNQGRDGIQQYIDAVNDQGAAGDVAAKKLDNLAGDVEELTGSLETLAIEAGGGANSGLRILVQTLTGVVNSFSALPPVVGGALTVLSGLTGTALLAAAAGLKLRERVGEMTANMADLGPAGAKAAKGLQVATLWGTRLVGAFAALQVAGTLVGTMVDEDLNPQVEELATSLQVAASVGRASGEAARLFGEDLAGMDRALRDVTQSGAGALGWLETWLISSTDPQGGVLKSRERIQALDAALAQLVQSGHADAASEQFRRLWQVAQDQGVTLDELQRLFPTYVATVADAHAPTSELAGDLEVLAQQTKFAVEEGQDLVALWDELNGRALTADQAMLAATEAVDKVRDSFKEGSTAIRGNSREALENRIAMEQAAKQAAEAAQAYLDHGGSAEGAERIMRRFRDTTVKATGTTGAARTQVGKLADELFRLPKNKTVNVRVNVDTNIAINAALDQVGDAIGNSLKKTLRQAGGIVERARGGWAEHAQSGLLSKAELFRGGPTLYAFAEPTTGGEAFVPRRGDRNRSLGILDHAAGWYGATVAPKGAASYGGMGRQTVEVLVRPDIRSGDRGVMAAITEGMRFDVRTQSGGSVKRHLGQPGRD